MERYVDGLGGVSECRRASRIRRTSRLEAEAEAETEVSLAARGRARLRGEGSLAGSRSADSADHEEQYRTVRSVPSLPLVHNSPSVQRLGNPSDGPSHCITHHIT